MALTASLQAVQSKLSSLQGRYDALIASKDNTHTPTPPPHLSKLNKPSPRKDGEPEIQEFEGRTWKWCDKCFGGVWNRTHVTSEHQKGKGRNKTRQTPSDTTPSPPPIIPTPQANLAETTTTAPQANIAHSNNYVLDFM